MKKLSYFISLACIALFASCSSDVEEFNAERSNTGDGMMTVAVSMPGQGDSRVDFSGDVTNMTWNYGDELRAVGYYQSIPSYSYTTYSQPTDAGYTIVDNKAIFKGSKLQVWTDGNHDCDEYRMVYHSPSLEYYCLYGEDDINCNYNGQIYGGYAGESEPDAYHLRDHLYMTTGKLKADNVKNTIQGGTLVPQCAVLRLNIESMPEALQNKSAYKIKFIVNYGVNAQPAAMIDYRVPIVNGKYIYMAFDPANDLPAGGKIGFVISDAAETVTYKVSALSQNGKNYEPAKVYTVNITNGTPWIWEAPKPYVDIYTTLNDTDGTQGWLIEGDTNPSDENQRAWFMFGNHLKLDTDRVNYSTAVNGTATTTADIQLMNTNRVTFNHIHEIKYQDGHLMDEYAKFYIKKVADTKWENLAIAWGTPAVEGSLEFEIPESYKGEKVQFRFEITKSANTYACYTWNIWNFKVQGYN